MKTILSLLFLTSFATALPHAALAQKNQAGVFAVANFNPTNYIRLNTQGGQYIVSSNSDEAGGAFEYRRGLAGSWQIGVLYAQNETQAKLFWSTAYDPRTGVKVGESVWPLMRYEADVLATRKFPLWKRLSGFVQGGPGWIITDSLVKNSGWSHNFALTGGYGLDVSLSSHVIFRMGNELFLARTGCYGDHTCDASWAVGQNLRSGIVYAW